MSNADLVCWIQARRAAEAREREALVADPRIAIESSLALLALFSRLHGWPPREDAVTAREDEQVRQAWDKVRAARRAG